MMFFLDIRSLKEISALYQITILRNEIFLIHAEITGLLLLNSVFYLLFPKNFNERSRQYLVCE
jgi:hypothetical protein